MLLSKSHVAQQSPMLLSKSHVAQQVPCCSASPMLLNKSHVAQQVPCCSTSPMLLNKSHVAQQVPCCSTSPMLLSKSHVAQQVPCCLTSPMLLNHVPFHHLARQSPMTPFAGPLPDRHRPIARPSRLGGAGVRAACHLAHAHADAVAGHLGALGDEVFAAPSRVWVQTRSIGRR